jgi:hypothetical protein
MNRGRGNHLKKPNRLKKKSHRWKKAYTWVLVANVVYILLFLIIANYFTV